MAVNALAAAWGIAEATLFFIVPDVLLTWLALSDARRAIWACLWTVCGALAGGLLMYAWGAASVVSAEGFLVHVPAVDQAMLDEVRAQLAEQGTTALFAGPVAGRPYKIYAVYAGAMGVSLPQFVLISIPARLIRFLLLTWATALLANTLFARLPLHGKQALLATLWTAFYAWYFWSLR